MAEYFGIHLSPLPDPLPDLLPDPLPDPLPSPSPEIILSREVENDGSGSMPGDVYVRGRGITRPIIVATVRPDGVHIRIDDAKNPEVWVEVTIYDEAVGRWWEEMVDYHNATTDDDDGDDGDDDK